MSLADLRRDYARARLDERSVAADPLRQFLAWLEEARRAELTEPNAMTLATASADGVPSARLMLLKAADERGFVFFTNADSQKGRELAANPRAALVFWWPELERQVRVCGPVSRVTEAESDAYFASRPEESRLGAWASRQSAVLRDRAQLESAVAEVTARYGGREIPRPPYWGGFLIAPVEYEFWQGRPGRLHDRLRYQVRATGWQIDRLSP